MTKRGGISIPLIPLGRNKTLRSWAKRILTNKYMKITLTKTWERELDGTMALVKSQITKISNKEQPDKTIFDIEDVEKCVDKHLEALEYLQDEFCECGNLKADESDVCEECL